MITQVVNGENIYLWKVPINDYPSKVRVRIMSRTELNCISEATDTSLTVRGEYIPNMTQMLGREPLHIAVESKSEYCVHAGVKMLKNTINEITQELGYNDLPTTGRFTVVWDVCLFGCLLYCLFLHDSVLMTLFWNLKSQIWILALDCKASFFVLSGRPRSVSRSLSLSLSIQPLFTFSKWWRSFHSVPFLFLLSFHTHCSGILFHYSSSFVQKDHIPMFPLFNWFGSFYVQHKSISSLSIGYFLKKGKLSHLDLSTFVSINQKRSQFWK